MPSCKYAIISLYAYHVKQLELELDWEVLRSRIKHKILGGSRVNSAVRWEWEKIVLMRKLTSL